MGNILEKNLYKDYDKDMEYWDNDIKVGFGIKRMKAYKCDLKTDDLQKKGDLFWKLKLNNNNNEFNSNWSIIQKALTLDDPKDIHYLQHFQIEPINGCINECKDKNGIIYKIPNYCINDPYFEREINDKDINLIKNEIKEIKIYRYGNYEPFTIKVDNNINGRDLKEECRKHENLDEDIKKGCLFMELKLKMSIIYINIIFLKINLFILLFNVIE